jgi:hypothetical protein
LVQDAKDKAERYRRMSLLSDLLGLVRDRRDWIQVLDHASAGFQGDPPLLNHTAGLTERLRGDDPTVRRAAASVLAREASTSAELMEEMLRHGDKDIVEIAGTHAFYGKRLPLFGTLLRSLPMDEYRKKTMRGYSKEDFETLLAMNDPVVDAACLEAISKGDRFELLELVLENMNRNPSDSGSQAIKRLLRGPDPFFENADRDSDEGWAGIETIHAPVAEFRESIRIGVGPNRQVRAKHNLLSAIKSIGASHDRSQWSFLRGAYLEATTGGTAEWWLACMAKAMHELDGPTTEEFLIAEIKGSCHKRLSAAFSSMGLIASRRFERPLDEFIAMPPELPGKGTNPPKYYFFGDGRGPSFLKYALHRCRGISSWKLVKNANGRYQIEKLPVTSR